jgi:tRNA-dihydrouridine synthase B
MADLVLPNNVVYSPLAGCSDYPFRRMVRKYHEGLIFCEMVKMDALVRHDQSSYHILDYDELMHPIGAQLCGSNLNFVVEASKIIEDLGFDVLDLNCGCPVDKVVRDGGSGLLKTPDLIGELLCKMVNAVNIPVTVKIRAGWDDNSVNVEETTRIAEEAGASAIFIHGRTRKQGYRGKACWDYIRQGKDVAKEMPVFGNGDVFDKISAENMMEETGCDGVLISRGTLGQPWLGREILEDTPVYRDCLEVLFEHFEYILQYYDSRRAVLDARKIGCWYVKNVPGARELRAAISKVKTIDEIRKMFESWEKDLGERIRTSDPLHPMQVR